MSDEWTEARYREAALPATDDSGGSAEWVVDPGVLPAAEAERQSVLLVAAPVKGEPTSTGKQKARRAEIPSLGPGDMDVRAENLGLNGSPTRVVKIFRPKVARSCQKVLAGDEGAIAEAADKLTDFLRQRELI